MVQGNNEPQGILPTVKEQVSVSKSENEIRTMLNSPLHAPQAGHPSLSQTLSRYRPSMETGERGVGGQQRSAGNEHKESKGRVPAENWICNNTNHQMSTTRG